MFLLNSIEPRVIILKLATGEDIICNLLFSKGDIPNHGLFKKSILIDPVTERECIAINSPIKIVNQIDLNSGRVMCFNMPLNPQAEANIYYIPTQIIIGITIPSDAALKEYVKYLKKNGGEEDSQETGDKYEHAIKFLTPLDKEVH